MFNKVDFEGLEPTTRANSRYMNLRRRKARTSSAVSSNHSRFSCRSANRRCQEASIPSGIVRPDLMNERGAFGNWIASSYLRRPAEFGQDLCIP